MCKYGEQSMSQSLIGNVIRYQIDIILKSDNFSSQSLIGNVIQGYTFSYL